MLRTLLIVLLLIFAVVVAAPPAQAQSSGPVYELRTYTATEGNLPAVLARFRNHVLQLFQKHGIESIGYWVPADPPKSQNTLVYLVRHPSREAATANWAAFRSDPEWIKAQKESEAAGKIVDHVESVFLTPTDFSKLK